MLTNISIYWIPLVFSLILTARTTLILSGRLKEPVLHIWEHYGDEILYYPMIHLLIWALTVIFCIVLLVQDLLLQVGYTPFLGFLGALGLIWLWITVNRHLVHRYKARLDQIPAFPLWYRDLAPRTTRYERRRIAYLWLRLPHHMKQIFNYDDRSFLDWADLVIMGIITDVNDPVVEDYMKWRHSKT